MLKFEVRHPDSFWISELNRQPKIIIYYAYEDRASRRHLMSTRLEFLERCHATLGR